MNRLLMIAARMPTPGATKTRLGNALGMARAARLYTAFLRDIAAEFDTSDTAAVDGWDLAWTYSPPDADFRGALQSITGGPSPAAHFVAQGGDDWGIRQLRLLKWGYDAGYDQVVLMASDSPQLDRGDLALAFKALDAADVVIGRVRDGGYYLIGMTGFYDVLSQVEMSTASAADGIVERTKTQGLRITEVPTTFDIDVSDDLDALQEFLGEQPGRCSATRFTLAELAISADEQSEFKD